VTAGVVAHGRPNRVGHGRQILDEIVGALALQFRVLLERRIQVVHIRRVMLAVMNLHRLRIDVRFERGEIVRQGGASDVRRWEGTP
jgi:hypothetical protein